MCCKFFKILALMTCICFLLNIAELDGTLFVVPTVPHIQHRTCEVTETFSVESRFQSTRQVAVVLNVFLHICILDSGVNCPFKIKIKFVTHQAEGNSLARSLL